MNEFIIAFISIFIIEEIIFYILGNKMITTHFDDYYIVTSESNKKKMYKVTKDLQCECKAFKYRKQCKHQKQVIEYIESGNTVDMARTGIVRYM